MKEGNDDPNYLGIDFHEVKKLEYIIRLYEENNKDIEVRIYTGLIQKEMKHDHRIREEIIKEVDDPGKTLLPEELKDKYRHKKICYCHHRKPYFNQRIILVFHELNHFNNRFDIGENNRKKWKAFEDLDKHSQYRFSDDSLKFHIINQLNEYYADYKTVKQLLNYNKFKSISSNKVDYKVLKKDLLKEVKSNLDFFPIKKNNNKRNLEFMRIRFDGEFRNLFCFMGGWRGFGRNKLLSKKWRNYLSEITEECFLSEKFLKSFKKNLINKKFHKLEDNTYNILKKYFEMNLNYQF